MESTGQVPDERATDQAAVWNGRAGCAWVEAQETLDRMFLPFEELLAGAIPAGSGQSVLDVGCGTGATTLALARRLGTTGRAVGIDISETMIGLARTRAERDGAGATFIVADAQTHAFQAASFDLVVSRFGVMFFDHPVQAFTNLRTAVKDGGGLRAIAWRAPSENPFMTTAERAAAPLLPHLPARRPDGPGQFAFADSRKVAQILKDGGWTAIDVQPIDVTCTLPTPELERYMTRLGPLGQVLQEADEPTRSRVIEAVRAAFQPFVHGDEVRYTAACWLIAARR